MDSTSPRYLLTEEGHTEFEQLIVVEIAAPGNEHQIQTPIEIDTKKVTVLTRDELYSVGSPEVLYTRLLSLKFRFGCTFEFKIN